jgi:hypothetical protein
MDVSATAGASTRALRRAEHPLRGANIGSADVI